MWAKTINGKVSLARFITENEGKGHESNDDEQCWEEPISKSCVKSSIDMLEWIKQNGSIKGSNQKFYDNVIMVRLAPHVEISLIQTRMPQPTSMAKTDVLEDSDDGLAVAKIKTESIERRFADFFRVNCSQDAIGWVAFAMQREQLQIMTQKSHIFLRKLLSNWTGTNDEERKKVKMTYFGEYTMQAGQEDGASETLYKSGNFNVLHNKLLNSQPNKRSTHAYLFGII